MGVASTILMPASPSKSPDALQPREIAASLTGSHRPQVYSPMRATFTPGGDHHHPVFSHSASGFSLCATVG